MVFPVNFMLHTSCRAWLREFLTGSWARIDWNCGPERTFDACKNSSSVRMVERERLICAGSGIVVDLAVSFVDNFFFS